MFFLIAFVTVPFTGVLVRYRLAYHPKEALAVAADPEAAPRIAPRIASDVENAVSRNTRIGDTPMNDAASSSIDASGQAGFGGEVLTTSVGTIATQPKFFGVAKRIYQTEGRSGFYKGIVPTIIVNFIMWISSRNFLTRLYISPAPSIFNQTLVHALVGTLFYSFALAWIYRSIATRTKLEVFGTSIRDGFRTLFTHFERARPYRIVAPSLLSALLAQLLLQQFVFYPVRRIIGPAQIINDIDLMYFVRLGIYMMVLILNTLICAPLEVVVTRLAVQYNHGSSHNTTEELFGAHTAVPPAGLDEKSSSSTRGPEPNDNHAVGYRGDDLELYTGVYDCAKKIVKEEGWPVLYRGWFITFLGKIY